MIKLHHYHFTHIEDRFGRRWVHCVCMVLATAPLMLSILFVTSHDNLVVVLSIISKVASNVGWFIMWVQCIEVCHPLSAMLIL